MELTLSGLGHTWILDLDGTIVEHNGYKEYGCDRFLEGAKEFLDSIPEEDMVIFLTSRKLEYKAATEDFLRKNKVRFDCVIYEAPYGERILVNDDKPSGLRMGYVLSCKRDSTVDIKVMIDDSL